MKAEDMKATETQATETRISETKARDLAPTEINSGEAKAPQWKTYRTRFLVKAKQLGSSLVFNDSLGRRHAGRKGDYLVESSDGVLSIAPRQIFEDIYVSMPAATDAPTIAASSLGPATPSPDEPVRVRRKMPQPCSGRSPVVSSQWSVVRGITGQGG